MSSPRVKLLWTGGWDSTFRLLDLALVQQREVQPYYVVDTILRPSYEHEIETMRGLRERLPAALVAPTAFRNAANVPEDRKITENWRRLRSRSHLGSQYDWLARLAAAEGLHDLELAIHRDDRAHAFLEPHVERRGDAFALRPGADPDLSIFARFRFPLFEMTKLEMQAVAERDGFAELLERTWFCATPTSRGRPCGVCGPCRYAREEGLARRIPLSGHARYQRNRVKARIGRTAVGRPLVAFVRRRRQGAA